MPDDKPTAEELIAELERLQGVGDTIRAQIKDNIKALQTNADEVRDIIKKRYEQRELGGPT